MDIKELRIGSYVSLNKGETWKDYQIGCGFDLYKLDESDCVDILPIPLTEEWIVKFGWKEANEKNTWVKDNVWWFTIGNNVLILEWENKMIDCDYVHQLQNLYRSLTGEELSLNHS